ncbi:MAG: UDP-N-acetylglucosamine 2-epimerase (non-hydrolyzing) [Candidatus Eremiobacteraeota bacterium]|nr:UDP-N-acetylglucosamine 2-epimerase (non-hydrolyzing) [Candidatus Eremiobacteraeota bacterium]
MRTILTIVGARPQFVKASVLSAELAGQCHEVMVHTGQHYDYEMSEVFFKDLDIRAPDRLLEVGSGSHAFQTAEMMKRLEPIMLEVLPDWVVVYGDTNTTLAGALVAAKLRFPVAHIEAGLRSFNRAMPEEVNRCVTDHLADLHFAPHARAARQLAAEGITKSIEVSGDLMVDVLLKASVTLPPQPRILANVGITPGSYGVVTIHRASNTEDPETFRRIIAGLRRLPMRLIFPVHPRTVALARANRIGFSGDNIYPCPPLSYNDMLALQRDARVIITDSGGMQKEALVLGVPCVTLRDETEWVETVESGWNALAGSDPDAIERLALRPRPAAEPPAFYGDGHAARRIAGSLLEIRSGVSTPAAVVAGSA